MKRYLLFTGENYYPRGGWKDFVASFDIVEEACKDERIQDLPGKYNYGWYHIVDTTTGKIVKSA